MQFVDPQRDLDLRAEHNSRNARRAANFQTERYRSPDDRARILTAQRTGRSADSECRLCALFLYLINRGRAQPRSCTI